MKNIKYQDEYVNIFGEKMTLVMDESGELFMNHADIHESAEEFENMREIFNSKYERGNKYGFNEAESEAVASFMKTVTELV